MKDTAQTALTLAKRTQARAIFLVLLAGSLWGCIGLFQFDLVAFACGGSASLISRIVYTLVGLSAVWCVSLLFRLGDGK